jgi:hypothetical protein
MKDLVLKTFLTILVLAGITCLVIFVIVPKTKQQKIQTLTYNDNFQKMFNKHMSVQTNKKKQENFDMLDRMKGCLYAYDTIPPKMKLWSDTFKDSPDKYDNQALVIGVVRELALYPGALFQNELDIHVFMDMLEPPGYTCNVCPGGTGTKNCPGERGSCSNQPLPEDTKIVIKPDVTKVIPRENYYGKSGQDIDLTKPTNVKPLIPNNLGVFKPCTCQCESNEACGEYGKCKNKQCISIWSELMVVNKWTRRSFGGNGQCTYFGTAFGGKLGAAIGTFTGPIGMLLGFISGSVVGLVGGGIADLFSASPEICGFLACLISNLSFDRFMTILTDIMSDISSDLGGMTWGAIWDTIKNGIKAACQGIVCAGTWLASTACSAVDWLCDNFCCSDGSWGCEYTPCICCSSCPNCEGIECCTAECMAANCGDFNWDNVNYYADIIADKLTAYLTGPFLKLCAGDPNVFNNCSDRYYTADFNASLGITKLDYIQWANALTDNANLQYQNNSFRDTANPTIDSMLIASGNYKPFVMMQGAYVLDGGHGHPEIHPMEGLAWAWVEDPKGQKFITSPINGTFNPYSFADTNKPVKVIQSGVIGEGDYPATSITWRLSGFANSKFHKMGQCDNNIQICGVSSPKTCPNIVDKERTVIWYVPLPADCYKEENKNKDILVAKRYCKLFNQYTNTYMLGGMNCKSTTELPLIKPGPPENAMNRFRLYNFPKDPKDGIRKFRYTMRMSPSDPGGIFCVDIKIWLDAPINTIIRDQPNILDILKDKTITPTKPITPPKIVIPQPTTRPSPLPRSRENYSKPLEPYVNHKAEVKAQKKLNKEKTKEGFAREPLSADFVSRKANIVFEEMFKFPIKSRNINPKTNKPFSEADFLYYDAQSEKYYKLKYNQDGTSTPDLNQPYNRNSRINEIKPNAIRKISEVIIERDKTTPRKPKKPKNYNTISLTEAAYLWSGFFMLVKDIVKKTGSVPLGQKFSNPRDYKAVCEMITLFTAAVAPGLKQEARELYDRMIKLGPTLNNVNVPMGVLAGINNPPSINRENMFNGQREFSSVTVEATQQRVFE